LNEDANQMLHLLTNNARWNLAAALHNLRGRLREAKVMWEFLAGIVVGLILAYAWLAIAYKRNYRG
jgi:hypothetical protein